MVAGDCMVVALSEELDDMEAEHPARNDSRAVAGLTVVKVRCEGGCSFSAGEDEPRKAIEAADLVVDSILAMETKKTRRHKEWRGEAWSGEQAALREVSDGSEAHAKASIS